jgi:hypothetical protein
MRTSIVLVAAGALIVRGATLPASIGADPSSGAPVCATTGNALRHAAE